MGRIQEYWLEIKGLADAGVGQWGLVALLAILGLGSFGLGRLSALEDVRPPVSVGFAPPAKNESGLVLGGQYVGSRSGHTYYFPWCSGAQSLKSANQIWFSSEREAQKAGFKAGKGCRGLEGS